MARKAKIDNALKKRFKRVEKKRAVKTLEKRVYFLIVCEGERTEPHYFEALQKELPIETVKLEIEGTGLNTIGLVDYAIRQSNKTGRKYDRIWAVFDRDSFPEENFNNAITKAKTSNINCAWTNEAFELWFLLHFQLIENAMSRDNYKAYLEREIKNKTGDNEYVYKKKTPNTYSLLKQHGNQQQAIEWAKRLKQNYTDQRHATHNPCTCVHELIEELLNPQQTLKKIKQKK